MNFSKKNFLAYICVTSIIADFDILLNALRPSGHQVGRWSEHETHSECRSSLTCHRHYNYQCLAQK